MPGARKLPGDCARALRLTCRPSKHSFSLINMSEPQNDWKRYIRPNLTQFASKLQPSLVLDALHECDLLTLEECKRLRKESLTEEERSHILFYDILLYKENDKFTDFCQVLLAIPGQKHIVTKVMKVPSDHPARTQLVAQRVQRAIETFQQSENNQQVCMRVYNLLYMF